MAYEPEAIPGGVADLVRHLDAAYNLARWLLRNEADAEDVVQEAFLRAVRSFHTLRGTESRPWLLGIVRNACYDWQRRTYRLPHQELSPEQLDAICSVGPSPERSFFKKENPRLCERRWTACLHISGRSSSCASSKS
jgi:RNA polymerase sigma factor (sigma-70 family)